MGSGSLQGSQQVSGDEAGSVAGAVLGDMGQRHRLSGTVEEAGRAGPPGRLHTWLRSQERPQVWDREAVTSNTKTHPFRGYSTAAPTGQCLLPTVTCAPTEAWDSPLDPHSIVHERPAPHVCTLLPGALSKRPLPS